MASLRVQLAAAVPGAAQPPRNRSALIALLVVLALVSVTWAVLEMRKARVRAADVIGTGAEPRDEYNLHFDRAEALLQAEDWRGLAALARGWADKRPRSYEAWRFLAIACSEMRDWPNAIDAGRHAVAVRPRDWAARLQLADDLSRSGTAAVEAERIYEQLYLENDTDTHLLNNYALLLDDTQRARSIALLERAVKLDPNYKTAWRNLAEEYRAWGDQEKATAAYAMAQ
jgi:tetratricopeptide (TPR) repeat protein